MSVFETLSSSIRVGELVTIVYHGGSVVANKNWPRH